LSYAWFQLDQNQFKQDSVTRKTATATATSSGGDLISVTTLRQLQSHADKPHGFEIRPVTDGGGNALPYVINDTMMRIDMPRALRPGQTQVFKIEWAFNIVDNGVFGGRAGYEHFRDSDTFIFFQAQWFPRLAAY